MSALSDLDWRMVKKQYMRRKKVHEQLLALHEVGRVGAFVDLALGIGDATGNYSADDHALGPRILHSNPRGANRVFDLAGRFLGLSSARVVPELIREAGLSYLKIGVGSELSCMMHPTVCWVANTRTIWAHLVIKHADDFDKANEELRLYRDEDDTSEMAYLKWAHIHAELAVSMTRLAEEGGAISEARRGEARPKSIPVGGRDFHHALRRSSRLRALAR